MVRLYGPVVTQVCRSQIEINSQLLPRHHLEPGSAIILTIDNLRLQLYNDYTKKSFFTDIEGEIKFCSDEP